VAGITEVHLYMTFDADIQAGQVTPYQGTLAN